MRLAILPDFVEEAWPSMDRCADMLLSHIPEDTVATRCQPRFACWFSRMPRGFTLDRFVNRYVRYPVLAKRYTRQHDAFHVVDHSYAHLVHALPAQRSGVLCHDLDLFRCLYDPASDPRPWWFRQLARHVLNGLQRASIVFHNSLTTAEELQEHFRIPDTQLVHAPLGVNNLFFQDNPVTLPWLEPWHSRPYLLHVGGVSPRKRIDVLLSVFALARSIVKDLILVKVGLPWTEQQQEHIHSQGLESAIVHGGMVNDSELAQLYRHAAVVLVPSSGEGLGLPVLEALACGTPVLASNLPSLREAGGSTIPYLPVGDVPAWSDAVVATLKGTQLSTTAERIRWASAFTWERHARIIVNTYRDRLGISPTHS